ncbi:subclass B1 metallo-beta-lactamase [bacterium SCSIO 12643]|nr:subclass B1 metallo-beta-lactamase [bacterium SCSIO 12643]
MKMIRLFGLLTIGLLGCTSAPEKEPYETETLKIKQISKNVYQHVSYLETQDFGNVACNGAFYVVGNEAIVMDTPTDDEVSQELMNYIQDELGAQTVGVIVNHFHVDCLGGLKAFHDAGISSYANQKTIELAREQDRELPQTGFYEIDTISVGGKIIVNRYFGPGHTEDNIVSYIPEEDVLYGGCMIKSVGAGKGNLEDANVKEWSVSVGRIKTEYPQLKYVIPGHGKYGGMELLDYTIEKFKE